MQRTSSATDCVEYPAALLTCIPLARAASRSTWSTPVKATSIYLSFEQLLITSALNGMLAIIIMSASLASSI